MATVEKPVKQHHQQTTTDFQRWLAKNPDADLKRKVQAFNAIADTNYKKVKRKPTKAIKKKSSKRI